MKQILLLVLLCAAPMLALAHPPAHFFREADRPAEPPPEHRHMRERPPAYALFEGAGGPAASLVSGRGRTLVLFWRADCAPCQMELQLLPAILQSHPHLQVALVALPEERRTQYIPAPPPGVRLLTVSGDARRLLEDFGDDQGPALPYSVLLDRRGVVCGRHFGILSPEVVRAWRKAC